MARYCKRFLRKNSKHLFDKVPASLTASPAYRRYLRARKFDINGAIGQFTDTEKWLKEQRVVELYDHFDVEFYERARLMVRLTFQSAPPAPGLHADSL